MKPSGKQTSPFRLQRFLGAFLSSLLCSSAFCTSLTLMSSPFTSETCPQGMFLSHLFQQLQGLVSFLPYPFPVCSWLSTSARNVKLFRASQLRKEQVHSQFWWPNSKTSEELHSSRPAGKPVSYSIGATSAENRSCFIYIHQNCENRNYPTIILKRRWSYLCRKATYMLQRGHRFVLFQILLGWTIFLCFAGFFSFFLVDLLPLILKWLLQVTQK